MTKYAIYFHDEGSHTDQLEVFTDLDAATAAFKDEVEKFKSGTDDYYSYTAAERSEWNDDFYPDLELAIVDDDDDEFFLESINVWTPINGYDVEV